MTNDKDKNNSEGKFRKKLYNEVSLILSLVALVSIVITVIMFIMTPDIELDKDLALLQQTVTKIEINDLYHVDINLEELKSNQKVNTDCINVININIAKIMTKMGIE